MKHSNSIRRFPIVVTVVAMVLGACGEDSPTSRPAAGGDHATIAVTTNILGDVVEHLVGDRADVVTIMTVGANPHDFQPSARQVNDVREADALVVNGGGFEAALLDLVESVEADGVPTHEAISAVEKLGLPDDGHADEDGDADEDHAHAANDPHFFTDPARMAIAAEGIAGFLGDTVASLDDADFATAADRYVDELRTLDAEIEETVAEIEPADRVLVTNHEVFGYFAERYDFEVVGSVIPSGTTSEAASGGDLRDLAEVIREEGVSAIFVETSSPDRLAATLAAEVGDVAVVELFAESLGEDGSTADTYEAMMRENAKRIVAALA